MEEAGKITPIPSRSLQWEHSPAGALTLETLYHFFCDKQLLRKLACAWFPGAPGCFSHFCGNLQIAQLGRMRTPSVWSLQRWRELLRTQAASHSCREGSGGGEGATESRFPCNQIQKLPGEPQSKSPQGAGVGSDTVWLIHPSRQIPGV